jgi:hypothetical protein
MEQGVTASYIIQYCGQDIKIMLHFSWAYRTCGSAGGLAVNWVSLSYTNLTHISANAHV